MLSVTLNVESELAVADTAVVPTSVENPGATLLVRVEHYRGLRFT